MIKYPIGLEYFDPIICPIVSLVIKKSKIKNRVNAVDKMVQQGEKHILNRQRPTDVTK